MARKLAQTGVHGKHALSRLLAEREFPDESAEKSERSVHDLQLKMLRIQQGVWHSKKRVIILFEGFDAAGKGGSIQRLTETIDPRAIHVHSIGPPTPEDQEKHYLYRFWRDLPKAGSIAIFDRSWYGRVLVERVEKLVQRSRWKEAYSEINQFEAMLGRDGIDIIKIFLAIHPEEQLKRFEARIRDPYKQWKLTEDDIEGHAKWDEYVDAADEMFHKTNTAACPWHLVPADAKEFARTRVLKIVTKSLAHHGDWMEKQAEKKHQHEFRAALKRLKEAARKRAK